MQSQHLGAAYEARQRRHYTFPTAQQDVLRVLERGPMRASRLAVALGVGSTRAEQTCAELIKTGQIKLDAEGFYELTEKT